MSAQSKVLVALSGGVDSAVAALRLSAAGHAVECLHMTNWTDDDGYCAAADDFQDARRVAAQLGVPLHRASFSSEYRDEVFEDFLAELAAGRTPNPDVACNRKIKFGVLRAYARRLGAELLATGHYARLESSRGSTHLLKARDRSKDQSYFLHAVRSEDLSGVVFPLGDLLKRDVRGLAAAAGLAVSSKKDSTGICFIGERPFASFVERWLPRHPGPIVTDSGATVGMHDGLPFYTIGQRQGLRIGGLSGYGTAPWYVAEKRIESNELVVVQGHDHPALSRHRLTAGPMHWIGEPPHGWRDGTSVECLAKTRYRQPEAPCRVTRLADGRSEVRFPQAQWAVTPGQYVVLYDGERCLGGATILDADEAQPLQPGAVQAAQLL